MKTRQMTIGMIGTWWKHVARGALFALAAGLVSWTTSAEAQVTKLVPLGPPRDEPVTAAATTEHSPVQLPAVDSQWLEQGDRESRQVQRVAYDIDRAREPLRFASTDLYDVRQAAYQPATPADVPPSLTPHSMSASPWTGSSSVPAAATPGYSVSPWTSSSGTAVPSGGGTVTGGAPAGYFVPSSPSVQRVWVPAVDPCAPGAVGVAGSVPVAQGPLRPLLPVTRPPRSFYVSSGILGQPVIYAPGQPIRNFFRYFSF